MSSGEFVVRHLGRCDYTETFEAMKAFTDERLAETDDELWLLEHNSVFTQGQAGKSEHLLNPGDIPVVQSDRGGQITFHGPGQLVLYILMDLRRRGLGVRDLVDMMEAALISVLDGFGIAANSRRDAPGVYVAEEKIAQLGLRVRRGCSYHGLSLNVDMDLEPFQRINPCGFPGLGVTSIASCLQKPVARESVEPLILDEFTRRLLC